MVSQSSSCTTLVGLSGSSALKGNHTPGKPDTANGGVPHSPHRARATCLSHLGKPCHSHRDAVTFQPSGALASTLCSWFQMMSFPMSPFPAQSDFDISGTVGGLRLTSPSGHLIPVKNLSENIEVEVRGAFRSQVSLLSSFSQLGWDQKLIKQENH